MDYGKFNSMPVWDRKFADILAPLAPVAQALLLITGLLCIWIALEYRHKPAWQLLALAFVWLP